MKMASSKVWPEDMKRRYTELSKYKRFISPMTNRSLVYQGNEEGI